MARSSGFSYLKLFGLVTVLALGTGVTAYLLANNGAQLRTDVMEQAKAPPQQISTAVFLRVDGFKGDSVKVNHVGDFEVDAFTWFDRGNAKILKVSLGLSDASPQFFQSVASGQHIKQAILSVGQQDGSQKQWKLTDVLLTGYTLDSKLAEDHNGAIDSLELTPKQFTYTIITPPPPKAAVKRVILPISNYASEELMNASPMTTSAQSITPAASTSGVLSTSPAAASPFSFFDMSPSPSPAPALSPRLRLSPFAAGDAAADSTATSGFSLGSGSMVFDTSPRVAPSPSPASPPAFMEVAPSPQGWIDTSPHF